MLSGHWLVHKGVVTSRQDGADVVTTAANEALHSLKQALRFDSPPDGMDILFTALTDMAVDSSNEARRLLKNIAMGRYGLTWAQALYSAIKDFAKRGNALQLYVCWLLTGLRHLAAELAEGGWIPYFSCHVLVRESLESGNTDCIAEMGGKAVPALINAAFILEEPFNSTALKCLKNLTNETAVNHLCAIWLENMDSRLANLIRSSHYIASGPSRVRIASALLNEDYFTASDIDATGVSDLVEWLTKGNDHIKRSARCALLTLKDTGAVNALVAHWASQRSVDLDHIVGTAGYVATQPLALKVLSALRNQQYDALNEPAENLIHPLLSALSDEDKLIVDRAAHLLDQLVEDKQASEALCYWTLRLDVPRGLEIAVHHGIFPQSLTDRALFFFLTEQWLQYESCDFDLSILRQWFDHGGRGLRVKIAETARRAGRLELVELVSGSRHRRKMGEMTAREWQTAMSILLERRDWDTLWRMAVSAPAVWAVAALAELEKAQWKPPEHEQQVGFFELASRARECKNDPPTIGMDNRPVYQFTAHSRRVSALLVSSYFNRSLATGSWDGTVGVWDMRDGSLNTSLHAFAHPVSSIAATLDGQYLFAGSGAHTTVVGWTMPEAEHSFSLGGHNKGVACLATSPDGRLLAAGGYAGVISLWRLSDQRLVGILRSHLAAVRCLAFSPDGGLLASGSEDGEVRVWDVTDQRLLHVLKGHHLTVRSVCFSPDGSSLITGSSDNDVIIWEVTRNSIRFRLQGHNHVVSAVAISGDGRVIASAGWDEQILLWDTASGKMLGSLKGHVGPITSLTTDTESRTLVSGGNDARVFVWYFQSGIFRRSTRRNEMDAVEAMLKESSDNARPWLEFLLAQMKWRWRFDIQIADDQPNFEIGEFDIEIEE